MPSTYFSDREQGPPAQVRLEVDATAWGGLVAVLTGSLPTGHLGLIFQMNVPDGRWPTGTNEHTLGLAVRSEIPELEWPIRAELVPPTMAVMDLLKFCHDHIAEAIRGSRHSYFDHYHLTFNRAEGQEQFASGYTVFCHGIGWPMSLTRMAMYQDLPLQYFAKHLHHRYSIPGMKSQIHFWSRREASFSPRMLLCDARPLRSFGTHGSA